MTAHSDMFGFGLFRPSQIQLINSDRGAQEVHQVPCLCPEILPAQEWQKQSVDREG
ncbi:hypothetical protein N656DRAFT_785502 [Canariomyces notabilis]|uniref:Uncharacterized protein n=1 Tax=Canariomyces notabilis TaxID=2074819 RepID=A0AAN6QBV8_9PEZI|nr:hypothetical protein N656DRAFT_785502 [Canariomyces arenarius]